MNRKVLEKTIRSLVSYLDYDLYKEFDNPDSTETFDSLTDYFIETYEDHLNA